MYIHNFIRSKDVDEYYQNSKDNSELNGN